MQYDPSGRIKTIPAGVMMPPGLCCVCGTTHGTQFADLDTHVDLYGALYLCEACALQAASIFGVMSQLEESALRDEIKTLTEALNSTQDRLKKADTLNAAFRTALTDLRGDVVRSIVDAPADSTDESPIDESDNQPDEISGSVHDEPDDSPVQDSGGTEESSDGDSDEPTAELDESDDPEPADSLAGTFEAFADESGSSSESTSKPDSVGYIPGGRLFGE